VQAEEESFLHVPKPESLVCMRLCGNPFRPGIFPPSTTNLSPVNASHLGLKLAYGRRCVALRRKGLNEHRGARALLTVICLMEDPDFCGGRSSQGFCTPQEPRWSCRDEGSMQALLVHSNQWIWAFCQWRATLVARSTVS